MALKHVHSILQFVNRLFPDTHLELYNLPKGSLYTVSKLRINFARFAINKINPSQ